MKHKMRLKIVILKIYESIKMERIRGKKGKNRKYEEMTI